VLTQVGRQNTDAFDQAEDLLGIDVEGPPAEEGVPTAEWIEVELTAPGEPPRLERRTLFDLLGPARRGENATVAPNLDQLRDRALRLAGYSEILILGANPSRAQIARATMSAVASVADNLLYIAQQPNPPELEQLPHPPQFGWKLSQFARERLANEGAAIEAPNVFMFHHRLNWTSDAMASGEEGLDIVFNDTFEQEMSPESLARRGVLDSILEGALLPDATSTANDTVADVAMGRNLLLVRPGEEKLLASIDADLRARIEADLDLGRVALLSPDESSRGWWRIDPTTGRVLAMRADGGGASMAETGVLMWNVFTAGACFASVGFKMAGSVAAKVAAGVCIVGGATGFALGMGAMAQFGISAASVAASGLGVAVEMLGTGLAIGAS
jgi:hypothetical protein